MRFFLIQAVCFLNQKSLKLPFSSRAACGSAPPASSPATPWPRPQRALLSSRGRRARPLSSRTAAPRSEERFPLLPSLLLLLLLLPSLLLRRLESRAQWDPRHPPWPPSSPRAPHPEVPPRRASRQTPRAAALPWPLPPRPPRPQLLLLLPPSQQH